VGGDAQDRRPEAGAQPVGLRLVPSEQRSGVRVVRVVPDVAAVHKEFDYTVPEALSDNVRVGTLVRIPLHGRRVGGWVIDDNVEPPEGVTLRPIAGVRGWGPPPEVLELARWAAWRWAGPLSSLLGTASPLLAVRSLPPLSRARPSVARVVTAEGPVAEALAGGTTVLRLPPAADRLPLIETAADLLAGAPPEAGVLILAPSQSAAADLAGRLRRAGRPVALLPQEWPRARVGGCVVIGARAAALAPLPMLAGAVVIDAHDEVYNEERAPTWCAWQVVAERTRRQGAPCVLVSPCPTLDVLDAGHLVTVPRSVERQGWPPLEIVDRRGDDPRTGLFSEQLVELVRWGAAEPSRRVLCVVNRTGRVRLLACNTCHEIARCAKCQAAVELVDPQKDGDADGAGGHPYLRCRRCGEERPVVCTHCGASRMKQLRAGVTRLREELEALAGTPVAAVWGPATRATASTTAQENDSAEVVENARVVVGTEAVLHRTRSADGVAFLDFDAELLAPRLRAGEEALALLARAARLVSRAGASAAGARSPGRLLVQTRMPDHDVLQAAALADPGRLAAAELEIRQALDLPPVSAMALVSGAAADAYGAALRQVAPPEVAVLGPTDGVWSVRAPNHQALGDLLGAVARPAGRLRVAVDPVRA
jgi:primosomal protein N' (replication factor Y)